MVLQDFYSYGVAVAMALISILLLRRKWTSSEQQYTGISHPFANVPTEQLPKYIQNLLSELPDCVILQTNVAAFQQALNYSWAQQNREIIPACIIRPHNVQQLGMIIKVLGQEYNRRMHARVATSGFFAIRSGGSNPGIGAATVQDGVVIDLSLFCEVNPTADGSTVTIGAGAKWIDVYRKLDETGLCVLGGRNSPVGVGGLTLQGGISFYSPRFGFVCSNAIDYEVVLADGSVVKASESVHPELWRALKGGSNNFGIVTRFTLRSVPAEPLWSWQMIAPAAFQHTKALKVFHDYLEHASSSQPGAFDENAAGPILSFAYVQKVGLHLMSVNLTYTRAPENNRWPLHWKETGFTFLWSVYSSSKIHSHTSAVEDFGHYSPAGTRHVQGTTTVRNDIETMKAAYTIFYQATVKMRQVQGLLFPFTFQAILPGWVNKGYPNVLGLEGCTEPLVIVNCSVTWAKAEDDEFVRSNIREMFEQIDKAAVSRQSDHPYRFINYCMEWQRPYECCGDENLIFMQDVSQRYDPDGLFQRGCAGGFKLNIATPSQTA